MPFALEHLKVIDVASYVAAPAAATVMADYGADVIKIEPLAGDGYRLLVGPNPVPYHWQLTSRSKRGLALDLRRAEGQQVLADLVRDADVLLTNFRPDQLQTFAMTWEQMSALNPRLIFAHLTGYGTEGPDANLRAFDATAWWARSGMMDLVRDPGQLPQQGAGGFGDHSTAMSLFGAIMMALYQRERSGVGGYVTTSLAANGIWANGMQVQGKIAGFDINQHRQQNGVRSPFTNTYKTLDDRYVVLTVTNPRKEWPALAAAVGHEDWLSDKRFANARMVFRHQDEVRAMLGEAMAAMSLAQVRAGLDRHEVAYGIVHDLEDVVNDPQLKANDVLIATGADDEHYQWTVDSPIQLGGQVKRGPTVAPHIGQHSCEILSEAGYSEAQIARLVEQQVVGIHVAESD